MEQFALNYDAPPLTDQEAAIREIVQRRRGRMAAIRADDLAAQAEIPERQARKIVGHLIEHHGVLIASATDYPAGYFVPVTAEEVEAATAQLMHRLKSLAVRIARIKRISVEEIFNQMRLGEMR